MDAAEVLETLNRGGQEGIDIFCNLAEAGFKKGDVEAIRPWVRMAFYALPQEDQITLVSNLLFLSFEADGKTGTKNQDAR
jgi:hypothetical protein